MEATGIILAGGKSSRMGSDKGLVDFKGKAMISHIIAVLEELNLPIVIIANNDEYKKFGYPVYKDLVHEKGPVGGIYTALHYSNTEKNILVSCDAPFVTKELLELLYEEGKERTISIPQYKNKLHPLIGVYSRSVIETFRKNLEQDKLRLREVCNQLNPNIVVVDDLMGRIDEQVFNNINTKEELKLHEL